MDSPLPVDASDEEWREFAATSCEKLIPELKTFLLERFSYKPRYVQRRVWRTFGTVSALSKQFDIYIRMFIKPDSFWPRECLVLARIGFEQQRAGHGRALVARMVELAPVFGYRYLAIESANNNAAAFAQRLGFTPYENGRHWVGSVHTIREALGRSL